MKIILAALLLIAPSTATVAPTTAVVRVVKADGTYVARYTATRITCNYSVNPTVCTVVTQ